MELASVRARLWERIAEHAASWGHRPDAIVVYGSAARADGGTASDIDLLVVRPGRVDEDDVRWQEDLTALGAAVSRWTGNPCEILDRSPDQLRAMADRGERLLTEIRDDGRAVVGALSDVPTPKPA